MIKKTVVLVAATGLIAASVAPQASAAPAPSCPPTRDLIIWQRAPKLPDSAFEVGNYSFNCAPTVDTFVVDEPTGPGYCNKIAWVDDNPGYDVDARPAPPLKRVIETAGDCS